MVHPCAKKRINTDAGLLLQRKIGGKTKSRFLTGYLNGLIALRQIVDNAAYSGKLKAPALVPVFKADIAVIVNGNPNLRILRKVDQLARLIVGEEVKNRCNMLAFYRDVVHAIHDGEAFGRNS